MIEDSKLVMEADQLCDLFEGALRAGERPDIEVWRRKSPALADHLLPELAGLELEYRLAKGEACTAEDYFQRYSELRSQTPVAQRLVAIEWRAKRASEPNFPEQPFLDRYGWSPLREESPGSATNSDTPTGGSTADLLRGTNTIVSTPPNRLGPYELLELLGQGGMGAVYKARHTRLNRLVAIKVLSDRIARNGDAVARFQREMKAVGALDHPNIVRATDADEEGGTLYLVMEYVDGEDLQRLVSRQAPLPVDEACRFIRDAALALAHAHRAGLVHRDIKPSNLIRANSGQVKVLDLGLSRFASDIESDRGLTESGASLGTPDYMAPEQWDDSHSVDHRVDLYALGCTLYFLLTGRPPFAGERYRTLLEKMKAHLQAKAPCIRDVRPEVSEGLDELYQALLAKSSTARLASADELIQRIEPFCHPTETSPAKPVAAPTPDAPAIPVVPGTLLIGGLVGFVAIVVIAIVLVQNWFSPPEQNLASEKPPKKDIEPEPAKQIVKPGDKRPAPFPKAKPAAEPLRLVTKEGWLDILPLIDVNRDRLWTANTKYPFEETAKGILCKAEEEQIKLILPLTISSSDLIFDIDFTPTSGRAGFVLDLPTKSETISVLLGNIELAVQAKPLELGKRQVASIHFRPGAGNPVQATINDSTYYDGSGIQTPFSQSLLDSAHAGIVVRKNTTVVVHSIRLRLLSGLVQIDIPSIFQGELPSFAQQAPLRGILPSPAQKDGEPRRQVFRRDPIDVSQVAWGPTGKTIATAGSYEPTRLYSDTGELKGIFNGFDSGLATWQPKGTKLVCLGGGCAVLWETRDGSVKFLYRGTPFGTVWSFDGTRFVTFPFFVDYTLRLWTADGKLLWSKKVGYVKSAAWSRDGSTIFLSTGMEAAELRAVRASDGEPVSISNAPKQPCILASSPHESILAIGRIGTTSSPDYVQFWDYDKQERVAAIPTGNIQHDPSTLQFGSDKGLLAMGTRSAWIYVWKWRESKWEKRELAGTPCDSVSWSPDGNELAYASYQPFFSLLSRNNSTATRRIGNFQRTEVRLSSNQRTCLRQATVDGKDAIALYSAEGKQIARLAASSKSFGFSQDGKAFLVFNGEGRGRLLDISTADEHNQFPPADKQLQAIAWSQYGDLLAGAGNSTIQVWEKAGAKKQSFETSGKLARALAFSPTNRWLAAAIEGNKSIEVFALQDGAASMSLTPHEGGIRQIYWINDTDLAVISGESILTVWNTTQNKVVRTTKNIDHLVSRVSEPTNPWCVVRDTGGILLRLFDGSQVTTLAHSNAGITQGRILQTPDHGGELSLLCNDEVIRTWNSTTGELKRLLILLPHDQSITFDPTGKILSQTEDAEKEIVYGVEQPNGSLKLHTPTDFRSSRVNK